MASKKIMIDVKNIFPAVWHCILYPNQRLIIAEYHLGYKSVFFRSPSTFYLDEYFEIPEFCSFTKVSTAKILGDLETRKAKLKLLNNQYFDRNYVRLAKILVNENIDRLRPILGGVPAIDNLIETISNNRKLLHVDGPITFSGWPTNNGLEITSYIKYKLSVSGFRIPITLDDVIKYCRDRSQEFDKAFSRFENDKGENISKKSSQKKEKLPDSFKEIFKNPDFIKQCLEVLNIDGIDVVNKNFKFVKDKGAVSAWIKLMVDHDLIYPQSCKIYSQVIYNELDVYMEQSWFRKKEVILNHVLYNDIDFHLSKIHKNHKLK